MILTSLHLHQFRSHADAVFEFDPHITAIIGPNGSGKTNILEAIYTLCMGKSFRDGDDELITYTQDWYRIEGDIDDTTRELRYQPSNKGKQLIVDGTTKGRFTYRQQLPLVLFEPDDLLMIHGSPTARRIYLDNIVQKLYPHLRQTFQRYERVVTQRNNVLKQRLPQHQLKDALFAWDVGLSDLGAKIIAARQDVIQQLNTSLSSVYSEVAGAPHTLEAVYVAPSSHYTETQLLTALHHYLQQDSERGFTTVGPHRHDIEFVLNSQSAKHTASRGEVRTILLSLKQIETQLLVRELGYTPLFLLDDVFSELDENRQKSLLAHTEDIQKIITTTHTVTKTKTATIELE